MTRGRQFHPIWVPGQRLRAGVSQSPRLAVGTILKLRHRVTYQSLKGTQGDRHMAPSACLGQRTEAATLASHRFTHMTPVTRDELSDTRIQRLGSDVGHHGTLLTRQAQTTCPISGNGRPLAFPASCLLSLQSPSPPSPPHSVTFL